MIAIALYFASLVSPVSGASCEEVGPRLDGRYVTICDGEVVGVRDGLGNSRTWDRATGVLTVRAPGVEPLALAAR